MFSKTRIAFLGLALIATVTSASSAQERSALAKFDLTFVEPITMLQGAAAVATIVGFFGEKNSEKEIIRRLDEISGQLNIIIERQDMILAEIEGLKVYFNEALRASFAKEAGIDVVSLKDRFDVAVAETSSKKMIAALNLLRGDAENAAFRMKEYGPANYQTAFAAATVLAAINLRTGVSAEQRRLSMEKISTRFAQWLEPAGVESVPAVHDQAVALLHKMEGAIAVYPRAHTLTVRTYTRRRCTIHVMREVTISGDIQSNFTGAYRDYERTGYCDPPCRPCAPTNMRIASAPYVAALTRIGIEPMAAPASSMPPLDTLLIMREEWRQQGEEVARLEAVISNIQLAKEALDTWGG